MVSKNQNVAPSPYILFPGNAREALTFYSEIFGCQLFLHTFSVFERTDGPPNAIAHGGSVDGPVKLYGADAAVGQASVKMEGMMLALLGVAEPSVLHQWFNQLSVSGTIIEPLQRRAWGATDEQVIDRFGLCWLVGYED